MCLGFMNKRPLTPNCGHSPHAVLSRDDHRFDRYHPLRNNYWVCRGARQAASIPLDGLWRNASRAYAGFDGRARNQPVWEWQLHGVVDGRYGDGWPCCGRLDSICYDRVCGGSVERPLTPKLGRSG